MGIVRRWRHGGVEYPLTADLTDDFLKVADPAIYYALEMFEHAIVTYAGDAFLARARAVGFSFPAAVRRKLHYEPTPNLLASEMEFPLLCLWRSKEQWTEKTIAFNQDASVWQWAYVLPPMTPHQVDKLNPIFRAISVIVNSFAAQSFDDEQGEDDFEGGKTLRDLSGIQKMNPGTTDHSQFEPIDENGKWWKAVTGQLMVSERASIVEEAFPEFKGVNVHLDETSADGIAQIPDFVEVSSPDPITISEVSPSTGSKAGGELVYITGESFPTSGEAPFVLIGGAYASSVVVLHPTRLQCLTPQVEAYPTLAADVQVIGASGQESNVLEAAYTFTTP